ncbi:MAG: heme A synthase [Caldilineaceae bacterium]
MLALISTVILMVWAYRRYPVGHIVRAGALAALIFMITEALVGAGLVLLEYVALDQSVARAYWMAAHLANTFLLLAALTLTAWWVYRAMPRQWRGQGIVHGTLGCCCGHALSWFEGAITALGDTLAPAVKLTLITSVFVGTLVDLADLSSTFGVCRRCNFSGRWRDCGKSPPDGTDLRLSRLLVGLFVVQLLVGAINVALKALVTMQLIHLLMADSGILVALLSAAALNPQAKPALQPLVTKPIPSDA